MVRYQFGQVQFAVSVVVIEKKGCSFQDCLIPYHPHYCGALVQLGPEAEGLPHLVGLEGGDVEVLGSAQLIQPLSATGSPCAACLGSPPCLLCALKHFLRGSTK